MGNNKYAEFQRELREQLHGTQSDGVPTGPVVLPEALQFGEVTTFGDTVLFDGDVSDKEYVKYNTDTSGTWYLVHLSEAVPTFEELQNGATVTVRLGELTEVVQVPTEMLQDVGTAIIVGGMNLGVVIKEDNTYLEGILFPKKGIYGMCLECIDGGVQYVSELQINGFNRFKSTAITPIQNKYLEPFIALNPSDTFVWDFSVAEKDTYFVVGEGVFVKLWDGEIFPSDLVNGVKVSLVNNAGAQTCEINSESIIDLAGVKYFYTTFGEGDNNFWVVPSGVGVTDSIPPGLYIQYSPTTWETQGCQSISITLPGFNKFSPCALLKPECLTKDEIVFSFSSLPGDSETTYDVVCNKSFEDLLITYRHRLTDAIIKSVRYLSQGGVPTFGNQVYHIHENYAKPKTVGIYTTDANKGGSERECRILLTFEVNESGIDPHTYGIFATFAEPTFKVMRLS